MELSHADHDPIARKAEVDLDRSTTRVDLAQSRAREAAYDSILVHRTTQGDDLAFAEIIDRYQSKIFRVAHRFLRNAADADEIAQDTFIRAHRSLAKFREDASLASWLYRIATNLSYSRYWYFFRRGRHDALSLDRPLNCESTTTLGDTIAADIKGPAEQAASSEFSELINQCIDSLDASHREVLLMRGMLNLPYEEIARTLRLEIGTVKSRIGRAREHLRHAINLAAPDFGPGSQPRDFLFLRRGACG